MRELRIDIKNKIATYNTRDGVIVCGNADYKIKFTFDSEWNEFEYKTARFIWNDKYIDVVFLGDVVSVPMLSQTTLLTVGVFAGENLHTTTPAKIPCLLSVICESDRANEADYYEVNGTLEYRLPVIKPEDDAKILQAINGKYELREAPDLTMNSEVVEDVLTRKVQPVADNVGMVEARVKTNETAITELNKLPAIIFDDEADIEKLAEKLNTDAKTIIGAINELAKDVDGLNEFRAEYDEEKRMLYIPFTISKFSLTVGGLYIDLKNILHPKIYLEILGTKYDISDWEIVTKIQSDLKQTGEDVTDWFGGFYKGLTEPDAKVEEGDSKADEGQSIGQIIGKANKNTQSWFDGFKKGFTEPDAEIEEGDDKTDEGQTVGASIGGFFKGIADTTGEVFEDVTDFGGNALTSLKGLFNRTKTVEEKTNTIEILVNAVSKNAMGASWQLLDEFPKIEFTYEFDFISNGEQYSKMKFFKQVNSYHWVLNYYHSDGLYDNAYSTLKTGGWRKPEYKWIIAQIPPEAVKTNIVKSAGIPYELFEEIDFSNLKGGWHKINFLSNGETFQYMFIGNEAKHIYYAHSGEETGIIVYGSPYSDSNWTNPEWRNIAVFQPEDTTKELLGKIAEEKRELLDTFAKDLIGAINEVNANVGNLDELETEGTATYSTRSAEKKSLVSAVNNVHRRTTALEEFVIELDEKVGEGVDTSNLQTKTDENLNTGSKEIVGAINEMYGLVSGIGAKTWVLYDDIVDRELYDFTYNFKFTSNGQDFNQMKYFYYDSDGGEDNSSALYYYRADGTCEMVYSSDRIGGAWYGDEEYKTISTTDDISLENIATLKSSPTQLETENKEIVGAINEVNGKTIDKLGKLSAYSEPWDVSQNSSGVIWKNDTTVYNQSHQAVSDIEFEIQSPFVAGKNIKFEVASDRVVISADTSNLATVNKIAWLDTWYDNDTQVRVTSNGVTWENKGAIEDAEGDQTVTDFKVHLRTPIVAGENVTFEVDEENQVVKINATGGGSTSSGSTSNVLKFNDQLTDLVYGTYPLDFTYNYNGETIRCTAIDIHDDGDGRVFVYYIPGRDNYPVYRLNPSDTPSTGYWTSNNYQTITVEKMPDDEAFSTFLSKNTKPVLEMPQIRFVGMPCSGWFGYVVWREAGIDEEPSYENLKFTVEISGGGPLQVGDAVQICRMSAYGANTDINGKRHPKKKKLRRIVEYIITEEDLASRFITFEVDCTSAKVLRLFTRTATMGINISPLYFRIRRPKGKINSGNNGGGMTLDADFSNVVTVWKQCCNYSWWDEEDEKEEWFYKLNIF